jgi:hypothetical protein
MKSGLRLYKDFIDGLALRKCVLCQWITTRGWPKLPENEKINAFLKTLKPAQKKIISEIVQEAYESGIHDTLVYLHDQISTEDMKLVQQGKELPFDAFESMNYDRVCRCQGDLWLDEKKKKNKR